MKVIAHGNVWDGVEGSSAENVQDAWRHRFGADCNDQFFLELAVDLAGGRPSKYAYSGPFEVFEVAIGSLLSFREASSVTTVREAMRLVDSAELFPFARDYGNSGFLCVHGPSGIVVYYLMDEVPRTYGKVSQTVADLILGLRAMDLDCVP